MRKRMSFKQHSRKFNKAHKRSRAINAPSQVMRGGIRL